MLLDHVLQPSGILVAFLLVVRHVCVNNTLHNVEDKVKQTALVTRINNFTKLCGGGLGTAQRDKVPRDIYVSGLNGKSCFFLVKLEAIESKITSACNCCQPCQINMPGVRIGTTFTWLETLISSLLQFLLLNL